MSRAERLSLRVVPSDELVEHEVEELHQFYNQFVERPADKWRHIIDKSGEIVIARERPGGPIQAFGAFSFIDMRVARRSVSVFYVHVGGVSSRYRGHNVAMRIANNRVVALRMRRPLRPLFVLFTASTYLSYLSMVRNYPVCWPRRDAQTPAEVALLVDHAMQQIGDPAWDREAWLLRRQGAQRYRLGVVADDPTALSDPDVQYYHQRNPGQEGGDSLMCVCPMTFGNMAAAASARARRSLRRWLARS